MDNISLDFGVNGFVSPIRILDSHECSIILRKLDYYEHKLGKDLFSTIQLKGHLIFPFLWDLVHNEKIISIVETIIGSNIVCWGSSLFAKDIGSDAIVPWHQDGTCWGLDGSNGLTVWLALTESNQNNGCMRVVPFSHTKRFKHVIRNNLKTMLPLKEEIDQPSAGAGAVSCILDPGEISIHHMHTVHGSDRNQGSTRRLGFAIRYIDSRMRNSNGEKSFVTMIKGNDFGNFNFESKPDCDLDPQALRRHGAILLSTSKIVQAEAGRLTKDTNSWLVD